MDKFDIHKWQRDAYNTLNEANSEEAFEVFKSISTSKKYNSLKYDDRKYVLDKLYKDLYLTPPQDIEDLTTEEAGTNKEMIRLISKVLPVVDKFLEVAQKNGELQDLKTVLATAESELKIDIPDTPEETVNISKVELDSIGRAKNLFKEQELGENKDSFEKKVINLLGSTGVLTTIAGALAEVSSIAGAADITGVGIFFMLVSVLLSSYSDSKDESINEFEIEEKPDGWIPTCPNCFNKLLLPWLAGYSLCRLCGWTNRNQ